MEKSVADVAGVHGVAVADVAGVAAACPVVVVSGNIIIGACCSLCWQTTGKPKTQHTERTTILAHNSRHVMSTRQSRQMPQIPGRRDPL